MNIVREQREQNNSLIKVTVGEKDYGDAVEKSLREYKRKANIPGFRPGMVPMGVIKKMYGKGVLAEQAYRQASEAAFNYLQEQKIDYVGDVIPSEEQGDFDFENGTEFEFIFEIGEAPEVKLELSAKDKMTYYTIKVDKKMHDDYRSNFLRRFGRLVDTDKVTADEALEVTLDNGDMKIEGAYVGLISMNEEERKPFIGKKVGFKTQVNVNELYKTPAQRAAVLQVKENELEGIKPEFSLEITKIRKFAEPELNEEFFKMAFPAGNVKTAEEFEAFVDAEISKELRRESDYLFTLQLRDFLLKKAGLTMPVAFLKRWLYVINEGKFTKEEIEKDFDAFVKLFTWNYLQKYFIKQDNLTVTPEEATAEAKALAQALFDDERNMVRIDMTEYMEKFSVSRLIGAPPGYVGYEEGGQLTEAVRRKPYSVVLFDEVEKAHPDVFNILLQVLDDGRITDSQGRTVDFKNTVIILTSNLGSDIILNDLEQRRANGSNELSEEAKHQIDQLLKSKFRPEFLNRLDEIVYYKSLTKDEMRKIVDLQLADLRSRMDEGKHLNLDVTTAAKDYIIDSAYDSVYGARPIKRFIQSRVETLIAKAIIQGRYAEGSTLTVDYDGNALVLK